MKSLRSVPLTFSLKITPTLIVLWKDKKVATVASTLYDQFSKKTNSYIREKHCRVDTEQQQSIYQYSQVIREVGCLDQNVSAEV